MKHDLDVRDLLEHLTIPQPPQMFAAIKAAGDYVEELADVISNDGAVCSQLIHTLNTPAFELRKKIDSVQQAVEVMGVKAVVNLAKTVLFRQVAENYKVPLLQACWDASTDVALCSAHLAGLVKTVPPHEAYMLGLFHNCGIPFIMQRYPGYREILISAYANESGEISEMEELKIGRSHADVSFHVAKLWQLPDSVCSAIEYHHDIDSEDFHSSMMEDPLAMDHLALLKMSEHLCKLYSHLGKQSADHEWQRLEEAVLEYTGISESRFYDLKDDIDSLLARM